MDLLAPSDFHTVCAYKGTASYLSADDAPDVAWYYPDPLHDALPVRDLVSLLAGRDVYVDGVPVQTGCRESPDSAGRTCRPESTVRP